MATTWVRINKTDGKETPSTPQRVQIIALAYDKDPKLVMETGRVETPYSIYERRGEV